MKNRGERPEYIAPLKDECDLEGYTPEQIRKIFEEVTPKFDSNNIKIPIIYGTSED